MVELRPYQTEAIDKIKKGWEEFSKQLLVLPTGTGKTVVFNSVAKDESSSGNVLILAHREELINQARDKYTMMTGKTTGVIKASKTEIQPVTVGSIQTMARRYSNYGTGEFRTIIIDEAHHALSPSYQSVLNHFNDARVLGVTATPDRGDKRDLSEFFDNIAYEYTLDNAINDGYLCPIVAKTIGINIDFTNVKIEVGDYALNSIADILKQYLPQIARSVAEYAKDRKTVVFLPLISIAQEFSEELRHYKLDSRELHGDSVDREETIKWFDNADKGAVLCNAMLLTEGWDCPSCDCVVVLRPTKIRSLYVQMVGRGTRLYPGKKNLLLLDFLWMTAKHNMCRPPSLFTDNEDDIKTVIKESKGDDPINLMGAVSNAAQNRRDSLAEQLSKVKVTTGFYNPLIKWRELNDYEPVFRWEKQNITPAQKRFLEREKIDTTGISKGMASQIISKIPCTTKQYWFLHYQGIDASGMSKIEAGKIISQLKNPRKEKEEWMSF